MGEAKSEEQKKGRGWWNRLMAWGQEHSYPLLAPPLALLLFLGLLRVPFFQGIENKTIDLRFQLRQKSDPEADKRLILIGVDEVSLRSYGRWPWPRSVHGNFLKLLTQVNPKVVGWDILFTEETKENPAADQALVEGANAMGNSVSGAILDFDPRGAETPKDDPGLTQPLPKVTGDIYQIKNPYGSDTAKFPFPNLAHESFTGFVDSYPDKIDGVRRKLPMIIRVGDKLYPSLVTQMLMQYWDLSPKDVRINLGKDVEFRTSDPDLGTVHVPIDKGGEVFVNYRNRTSFRQSIPYLHTGGALTEMAKDHKPWPEHYPSLTNHILLIGETAVALTDFGPTPLDSISPLVMTHMNLLNNILKQDFLSEVNWWWVILGWFPVAYVTLFYTRKTPTTTAVLLPLGIGAAYSLALFVIFWKKSILYPAFWPLGSFFLIHFGSIVLRWLEEQASKEAIKGVFGSFVSENVMNQLLKSPENVKLGGDSKPVTIFFSDIRSFSTFSENMGVQELISQLNEYFVRMVNRVIVNDGTLHKFIGDAVMAVWGDVLPSDIEVDAKRAVRAAVQMREELIELNKLRRARGLFDFHIGMGLNHGTVVVGNIGAEGQKLEFTVIGDAVNLASRLEGVTKQFHTDLVIGESVRALIGDEFLLRSIGLLVVKGKTKPIRAYEVFEEKAAPNGRTSTAWVELYEKGFDLYLERKFAEAIACFEECLKTVPDDFCTLQYLEDARNLLANPPDEKWHGVLKLESK